MQADRLRQSLPRRIIDPPEGAPGSDLLHELCLENQAFDLGRPTLDLALFIGQVDVLEHGAAFDHTRGAFHLEILDDLYGIALAEGRPIAVPDNHSVLPCVPCVLAGMGINAGSARCPIGPQYRRAGTRFHKYGKFFLTPLER